jgi:hypothetical protein
MESSAREQVWERRLYAAGVGLAIGGGVHVIDHLRRGQGSVSETLYVLGNLSLVLEVVAITLVLVRHHVAPAVATAAGFSLAVGFAAAHWLPHWSPLSDPIWEVESLVGLSVVASGAEIVAALALAITGLAVWKNRLSMPRPARGAKPVRGA